MTRCSASRTDSSSIADGLGKSQDLALASIVVFFCMLCCACGGKGEHATNQEKANPQDLAFQYMQQNRLDEAEAAFIQAIAKDPRDKLNYNELASLYILQKNYSAADSLAKKGLAVKPDNGELRLIRAAALKLKGDREEAVAELKRLLATDPKNIKAYYQLAGLGLTDSAWEWKKTYLIKVIELAPGNIVPRLELVELLARQGDTDSAMYFLESVRKIAPAFSPTIDKPYKDAIVWLHAGQPLKALSYIRAFHDLMRITPTYASGFNQVNLLPFIAGYPQFISSQFTQATNTAAGNLLQSMKFTDATKDVALSLESPVNAQNAVMAISDYNEKGDLYLYSSTQQNGNSSTQRRLLINKSGSGTFEECKNCLDLDPALQDFTAGFADYDNDGYQDLFVFTSKGAVLYKNQGDGTFTRITGDIGLNATGIVRKVLFADFDQDGDLDIYVAQKGGNKFFRNNGDGTFTEQAGAMGLVGDPLGTLDMDFGDWDDDGDLDIAALNENGGIRLLDNNRHAKFRDISDSVGLGHSSHAGTVIAWGDYNNDGRLDLFIAGDSGGKCSLYRNEGADGFVLDPLSRTFDDLLQGIKVRDAVFFDFDNDGHMDLLVAGVSQDNAKSGVRLFHNDSTKGFSDASYLLPSSAKAGYHIEMADYNLDGDEDIFLTGPNGPQLLRNDGGNRNHFLQVQLIGLSYGNSRNNRLGIGAQIEAKAGDLYQVKTVTRSLMQFGIGSRDSVDALRIIWPNGVPQTIVDPSSQEKLIEQEKLKGSCPFLFTWNGKKYEFIKDMLWRSALGMPLSLHGKDTTYAFCDASKEYLLIPGEKLQSKNGLYSIKITEELWEAVYFDKAGLVAVDHPDSVEVYADERFVPPPFPGKKVYAVRDEILPVSAKDGMGNDLLPKISRYDFQYVANFSLGKFQGLAEDHDLILDLGDSARGDSLLLFLRGWVYPPDASINMALAQSHKYQLKPPSLQVINKHGKWETVINDLGYPMGRDKMVIANLSGKFLTANDRRVRITTNMQIYWDQVFFTRGTDRAPVRMHDVRMAEAELRNRGYSASYRKGGPYGPEWLDYYTTSTGQKWRDLTGYYTRYGNVLPLLKQADDQYVIANSGDELTIDFDARRLPALPKGWKRDFLIYSEGWVKDGDLNTAYGQTVEPLPFHRMPVYPYGARVAYPSDAAHNAYRKKYNTRKVTIAAFRDALKQGSLENAAKAIR